MIGGEIVKYTVLGNVGVLVTRNAERVGSSLCIEVEGVPNGSSVCLECGGEGRSYDISDGKASVPYEGLTEGRCSVVFVTPAEDGQREVQGNTLYFYRDITDGTLCAVPAPTSSATEHERLWCVIAEMLNTSNTVA